MTQSPPAPPPIPQLVGEPVEFGATDPVPSPRTHRLRRVANRLLPRTLSAKLVTGVVALLLIVMSVSGTSTYFLLRPFLQQRLDQQLSQVADGNINPVRRCLESSVCSLNPPGTGTLAPVSPQREWLIVCDSSGAPIITVREDTTSLAALRLSAGDRSGLINSPNKSRTLTTTDGDRVRVTVRVIPTASSDNIYVLTGLSTEEINHTLGRLLLLEFVVGAALVLLAAGLTSWGVRAGLRPLRRVTRTAQEVTAELGPAGTGLQRRVPDADPSTEVGQVASSVNTLLQAVETEFAARVQSEERMRQFLADASHELRTPLTSIRGYAELSRLQRGRGDAPDDTMHRIEIEGTRMSRLVEDLLVLARGDQGAPAAEEAVDIDSLLGEAAGAARATHPERALQVLPSGGAVVVGDRDQLRRALVNLLTNAAVHTAPDGPIRLEAVPSRMPDGRLAVAIEVIDAGPGLSPDEAEHVFERFWRADKARSRAKGGSGLGMAIVAQIVQSHGGTVRFASTVETGTTVTVTLPVVTPGTAPAP